MDSSTLLTNLVMVIFLLNRIMVDNLVVSTYQLLFKQRLIAI